MMIWRLLASVLLMATTAQAQYVLDGKYKRSTHRGALLYVASNAELWLLVLVAIPIELHKNNSRQRATISQPT